MFRHNQQSGYANFVVPEHQLKLVLFEAPGAERLNHVGFELFDDDVIDQTAERLAAANLLAEHQQGEVCCYARQNKAVAYDPQGLMWEWYRVLEDSPTFFAGDPAENEVACCPTAPVTDGELSPRCCG